MKEKTRYRGRKSASAKQTNEGTEEEATGEGASEARRKGPRAASSPPSPPSPPTHPGGPARCAFAGRRTLTYGQADVGI